MATRTGNQASPDQARRVARGWLRDTTTIDLTCPLGAFPGRSLHVAGMSSGRLRFPPSISASQQVFPTLSLNYEQALFVGNNGMSILTILDNGDLPSKKTCPHQVGREHARRSICRKRDLALVVQSRI